MNLVKEKVVLITGAAGGIGAAVAHAFAAKGAHLALLDINAQGLERLAAHVRSQGSTVEIRGADLSTELGVREGIAAVLAPYQDRIDILVANVGALISTRAEDLTAQELADAFAINCFTHVWACRCVIPRMRAQQQGCIIFTGSDQAAQPNAGLAPYGPAKAALLNYAHILAQELAPLICVHTVAPGITQTPLVEQRLLPQLAAKFKTNAEHAIRLELAERGVPLGRPLEPDEVAQAFVYCAESGLATTGMTLNISGGNVKSVVG